MLLPNPENCEHVNLAQQKQDFKVQNTKPILGLILKKIMMQQLSIKIKLISTKMTAKYRVRIIQPIILSLQYIYYSW